MADSRIVPRFSGSKENLWKNVEWGVIVSADLTPDFKLDLKPKPPYQRQEAPVLRGKPASAGRLPLAPLAPLVVPSDDIPYVGGVFDITKRVLGVDLADQEADLADKDAKLATKDAQIANLKTHIRLQENVIGSFCAYYQHKNVHAFR